MWSPFFGAKEIRSWVNHVRSKSNGVFQLNTWIPDPEPKRDHKAERSVCEFLEKWGPAISAGSADIPLVDFQEQCNAFL